MRFYNITTMSVCIETVMVSTGLTHADTTDETRIDGEVLSACGGTPECYINYVVNAVESSTRTYACCAVSPVLCFSFAECLRAYL